MPTPVQARFDSREKHADLTKAPCNILADFKDVQDRLAAVEEENKQLKERLAALEAKVG